MTKAISSYELYRLMRIDQKIQLPCWNKRKYHRETALFAIEATPNAKVSFKKHSTI